MRKDISLPEVKGVSVVAVQEYNKDFRHNDWNAYIINENDFELEMILIVSKGYDAERETSLMRHKLKKLPKQSYAKIEFLEDSVLALNNEFKVTYFANGNMYDKTFVFRKNTINDKALRELPLMGVSGVFSN